MGPVQTARYSTHFPGLDVYYADLAHPFATAGEELDYLDHDLSEECNTYFR